MVQIWKSRIKKNPTNHYALITYRDSYIRILLRGRILQCFSHSIGTAMVPCLYMFPIVYLCFTGLVVFCYIFRHIHSSRKDVGQGGPLVMDFLGSMVFAN